MRQIEGSCHCRNIRYTFSWPGLDAVIPVRACSCTFCTKHGGVYTSHPDGKLRVDIEDQSLVNVYRFGTETADFHICSRCGVVPFVTSTIRDQQYAVVNTNTFENVDPLELSSSVSDFEGEATSDRLDRRQRTWIANVNVNVLRA